MKYFISSFICIFLIACNAPSKNDSKEQQQESNVTIEQAPDINKEVGLFTEVEDGAYPFYNVQVYFPQTEEKIVSQVNIESVEIDGNQLKQLINNHAMVTYSKNMVTDLHDVLYENSSVLEDSYVEEDMLKITGKLNNADAIASGDLPGSITVTNSDTSLSFEYYVEQGMVNVNNKEVTVFYSLKERVTLHKILPLPPIDTARIPEPKTEVINYEPMDYETFFVDVDYLIIQSTTSYDEALATAKNASEKFGIELDLRGYIYSENDGLQETEECSCGEVHDYIPRGRYDKGKSVSIEHTDSYTEFTDGYYIVVAASGDKKEFTALHRKILTQFPDAYFKTASVYIGCMH